MLCGMPMKHAPLIFSLLFLDAADLFYLYLRMLCLYVPSVVALFKVFLQADDDLEVLVFYELVTVSSFCELKDNSVSGC